MDAIQRSAQIKRTSTERVTFAAFYQCWQLGMILADVWRWRPVRPFALSGNGAHSRPGGAFLANADRVAERLAISQDVIKVAFFRGYDNGSRRVQLGIRHRVARGDVVKDSKGRREECFTSRRRRFAYNEKRCRNRRDDETRL